MQMRCPRCRGEMSEYRSERGMSVACAECGMASRASRGQSAGEAYLGLVGDYESGRIPAADAADAGGAQSRAEVDSIVGGASPPQAVMDALYSPRTRVAHYTMMKKEAPKLGAAVGDMRLDARLADHLRASGIERLYAFQEEAVRRALEGQSIVIEAPTAFGKTEAFVVPAVQRAASLGEGGVYALFAYPTKALARDQLPRIAAIAAAAGVRAAVYDGDTPPSERASILARAPEILVTNFDMIHHHMWRSGGRARLLSSARMLVVDEAHVYTGIFGSNAHHVIARLRRLTQGLQCIAASATLRGSGAFCSELFGQEVAEVGAAGRGADVDFAIVAPHSSSKRRLMVDLARRMSRAGRKTIVFSNSHRGAELVGAQAARRGIRSGIHRSGLNPAHLRRVEAGFKSGRLDVVSCTPTLELGMDIGGVDSIVSEIVPADRFMQRMGRAGRGGQRGCAFLALGDDPISQYYGANPGDYMLDGEVPCIDASNPYVAAFQTLAMACDRPLSASEAEARSGAVEENVRAGRMAIRGGAPAVTPRGRRELAAYSIRGIAESVEIRAGRRAVGSREMPLAIQELHEDAVYLMAGRRYRVRRLDLAAMRAEIEPLGGDSDEETRSMNEDWPEVLEVLDARKCGRVDAELCRLRITKTVLGYARLSGADRLSGEVVKFDRPLEFAFETKGVRFCAARPAGEIAAAGDPAYVEASAYHAAEHVLIEGSRMITGGASQDLGGLSMGTSGMIFIYDGAIGGSGASRALYERFERVIARARDVIAGCPCESESGCPRCTYSYRCGNNNQYLHKAAAHESLRRMAAGEATSIIDVEGQRPIV